MLSLTPKLQRNLLDQRLKIGWDTGMVFDFAIAAVGRVGYKRPK